MRGSSRLVISVLVFAAIGVVFGIGETARDPTFGENLLLNPGVESGSGDRPVGWTPIALPGEEGRIEHTWEDETAHGGARALRISSSDARRGIWQQIVPVQAGTVYALCGYVAFEGIVRDRGECRLQVVFRDAEGVVLRFIDYPGHDGTRPFELDFPAQLKFRAPEGAARAEINGYLQGPGTAWFDDLVFAEAPVGDIVGQVTSEGAPLPEASVWIHGDPWGAPIVASTDDDGRYRLEDVPVAFPRYIVFAAMDGYRTVPAGDIAVIEGGATTVDFELVAGDDPRDDLDVRYGFLTKAAFQEPIDVPRGAIIPADATGYPASVREFLQPDAYITSDDPGIMAAAAELLASIPPPDRSSTYAVSWAVFEWVSRTFNHDAVFGNGRDPYRDVTSGIWQTIQDGGWCWGRSFYDWAYTAAESIEQGSFICVEHAWLCAALLRALGIPARASVGSAQFWAQSAIDDGARVDTAGSRRADVSDPLLGGHDQPVHGR